MAAISSPAAHVAAVAVLLVVGTGVDLTIDGARADDNCLSAPGAPAPAGQHWYYRIDHVSQHKCWYVRAMAPLPNHDAAKSPPSSSNALGLVETPQLFSAATPHAANAKSATQPPSSNSNSVSEVGLTQLHPHVTVLSVRPIVPSFADTRSDAKLPVGGPAGATYPAAAPAMSDTAHNSYGSVDTKSRTHLAHLFLILALAFGVAAAIIALSRKMLGLPRLSDHGDDTWRRVVREEDAPLLPFHEPHGLADLDQEWMARPTARAERLAVRPGQSERFGPNLEGIELALRALREVRQSMART